MENMDKISEMIDSVLSDPESMNRLRETARQLGLENLSEKATEQTNADKTAPSGSVSDGLSALAPALGRIAPLLSKLNEEDDMTRLIHALKPYLSGARLKRAEEADRIVSVMRIMPFLKQL